MSSLTDEFDEILENVIIPLGVDEEFFKEILSSVFLRGFTCGQRESMKAFGLMLPKEKTDIT